MAVESATYVGDLVSSNPIATDLRSQGDDHIRLVKAALQATFPNATKPFYIPSGTTLQTSTVTVATTDDNKLIPVSCEAAARTVNLPQGSTLPDGFTVKIVKADHSNNLLTIDGYSSETINGALTITLWQRYQQAVLQWVSGLSAWVANVPEVPAIGTVSPYSGTSAPTGWLLMEGGTIGNASSSGTARANEDCRGLFYHLWASYSNSIAAVSGGRGASAAADFAANKNIAIPSMIGRSWFGLDTGGTVLGGAVTGSINGNTGGVETVQLSSAESGQKAISNAPVDINDPGHDHSPSGANVGGNGSTADMAATGGTLRISSIAAFTITTELTGISASFSLAGSQAAAAHTNMPPCRIGTWIIKL